VVCGTKLQLCGAIICHISAVPILRYLNLGYCFLMLMLLQFVSDRGNVRNCACAYHMCTLLPRPKIKMSDLPVAVW